jgi:YVTN family beta-propeller protein
MPERSMIDVRILGSLGVTIDGRPVSVGGGKQRLVFAALLLRRGEPVSVDQLIDLVWDERPPANAVKSIQVYVSQLRKELGPDRIATEGGGYLLRVQRGALDSERFEDAAARGDAELAAGDAGRALTTLREGLALWRGEPLAEFRYEAFAQAEVARLEELRQTAIEQRIDAELMLGRHRQLVAELEQLVRDHPLRERLLGQLMVALYRSGRQADALDRYRAGRTRLDQELGLEPSPELRSLERAILEHDPALGAEPLRFQLTREPRHLVLGGGVLLVIAAVAAALVLSRSGSTAYGHPSPNTVAVLDESSGHVVAQIPVGAGPVGVAVEGDAVWVANGGDDTLTRIDASTRDVAGSIGLGRTPSAITTGAGGVWVASGIGGSGAVFRVEPQSNDVVLARITRNGAPDPFAPPTPSALAVGGGGIWTNGNPRFLVERLSVSDGRLSRPVRVGSAHSVDGLAYGFGALWIASSADDSVLRLDPTTGHVVAVIRVAAVGARTAGPYGIAVGDGSVWVTDALASRVSRIDPHLNTVSATIVVGRRPTAIVIGGGRAWVLNRDDGTVMAIDSATDRVITSAKVGTGATGIAEGAGAVWVTVAGSAPTTHPVAPPAAAEPLPASICGRLDAGRGSAPTSLIASDLPRLSGGVASRDTRQMMLAIQLVLREAHHRAGRFSVGYQACDDSTPAAGDADPTRCLSNARAYAGDASLLAEIGPYNSFCGAEQLPITNASPAGPLATVSPTSTYVGLTQSGPATTVFEPDVYRPTGVPSFLRLAGDDQAQGAADAQLAKQLGLRRLVLIDDGTGTAAADADYLTRAAGRLGIRVVGRRSWSARAAQYKGLARWVAAAHPDGVYLSGCVCANGWTLLDNLRARLPPSVALFAPDNFDAGDGEFGLAGRAATGLYISSAGVPVERLDPAAAAFASSFRRAFHQSIHSGAVIAVAQAAQLVLKAIAASDGTRPSVLAKLKALQVDSGLLGSFAFDRNGDPTKPVFSIYRIGPHPAGPNDGPPFVTIQAQGGVFDRVIQADPRLAAP